jgi:hypothetical protein
MKAWLLLAPALAGCIDGIDPIWQLDHDRIVAVRATPPHIAPGASATFDALIAHKGAPTDVEPAVFVTVADPQDLAFTVANNMVTAPDAAVLDNERAELGLDPGIPVPLDVIVTFPDSNGIKLIAKKTVYLGDSADNAASVGNVTVGGDPPPASLTVPIDVDVHLDIDADPTAAVNWLSSCGTMHDDDEHAAFLHVLPKDPLEGELAVVVRDIAGGVVWQVWPIVAQ